MIQYLLYPPITFAIFCLIGIIIYSIGTKVQPKARAEAGKYEPYACGEDVPAGNVQPGYHLFHFAFFFTVLHVAALIVATVPSGPIAVLGVVYLIAILGVILILLNG
jgi:hypothetical protein